MRILLAVALLGAAPPLAPHSTLYSDGLPPERFQGETTVVITFVPSVNTRDTCGIAGKGYAFLGCTRRDDVILMPNPCQFPRDDYARILCHEKGHRLGWPATHGD